jgi:ribonuclease Z
VTTILTQRAQGRDAPLDVYGPTLAYALDSSYRTAHHGAKYLDPANGKMIAKEIALDGDSATVLDDGDLKVTMFAVNHAPIHPAVGYRH